MDTRLTSERNCPFCMVVYERYVLMRYVKTPTPRLICPECETEALP